MSSDARPTSSRAAVLVGPNRELEVWSVDIPEVQRGCALIRTSTTGVCGTDVHYWKGHVDLPYPTILGHESVGEIAELGEGVSADFLGRKVSEGDKVFWISSITCGKCYYCAIEKDMTSCLNRKGYGNLWSCRTFPYLVGGYSEYVYLPEGAAFVKVPDNVKDDEALAFGCGGPTIVKGVEYAGGIQEGSSVVIQGCGPVGLFGVLWARLHGAETVICVGTPSLRLKMAEELGATATIDISEIKEPSNRKKKVLELTGGIGADFCIEATGSPNAFPEGIELTRTRGKYLLVGLYSDMGAVQINPSTLIRKNMKVVGSKFAEPRHYYRMLETISRVRTRYPVDRVVSHHFPLERATEAILSVNRLEAIKSTIVPARD